MLLSAGAKLRNVTVSAEDSFGSRVEAGNSEGINSVCGPTQYRELGRYARLQIKVGFQSKVSGGMSFKVNLCQISSKQTRFATNGILCQADSRHI